MIVRHMKRAGGWFRQHHKRVIGIGVGGLMLIFVIVQLRYPSDLLLPFTRIDGVDLGAWSKANATLALDTSYKDSATTLYFSSEANPYATVKPSDLGITAQNNDRIQKLDYPWYLRIVPGSLLWGHFVLKPSAVSYQRDDEVLSAFLLKKLGENCSVEPIDASLEVKGSEIKLDKGSPGGTCDIHEVTALLEKTEPSLTTENKVILPVKVKQADVGDDKAQALAETIEKGSKDGVVISLGSDSVTVTRDMLLSWLDFSVTDGTIDFSFNADRANKYLSDAFADKVAVSAGTTTIHTYNFAETSRETGRSGQSLDIAGTLGRIKSYIKGEIASVEPAVTLVAPAVKYERSYSADYVGLSALMQNFAQTHAGMYGIVLNELSGQYRRASYQSTKSFTTASTYKLFVAYSTLLRIESGAWHWSDQITGGRDLTKCFDDMIVVSDNACAEALLYKIGFTNITNEAHAIGCIHTSFLGNDGIKSTPEDIALFLGLLQTNQVLSQQSSRDTLINAMKRNIYRQGIPAGESGAVADKVGFLWGLLHDAAIVYSSTGPYVLVIMTDGSSWANIAELTRQIEALRLQ